MSKDSPPCNIFIIDLVVSKLIKIFSCILFSIFGSNTKITPSFLLNIRQNQL